jgi:predicted aspartyl protease
VNQHYLFTYFPPIPVLNIALSFPDAAQWHGLFLAIIDSGADYTIVPFSTITPIDPPLVGSANLVSQWQERHEIQVYQLDIQIGSMVLLSVEVAGDPNSDELILGRNVLNELNLRLNGPALQTELAEMITE